MNTLLRPSHSLTLIIFLLTFMLIPLASRAELPLKNQVVTDIYFKDIKNREHHLAEYRGKWLFLNFWAGYCEICREEIPTLIRFQQSNKDKVTILGVNYGGETHQEIKAAIARYKFNYDIIPGQSSISRLFSDVVATPTTIVISPDGRMIAKAIGQQSPEELLSFIRNYKKEEPRWAWDY